MKKSDLEWATAFVLSLPGTEKSAVSISIDDYGGVLYFHRTSDETVRALVERLGQPKLGAPPDAKARWLELRADDAGFRITVFDASDEILDELGLMVTA